MNSSVNFCFFCIFLNISFIETRRKKIQLINSNKQTKKKINRIYNHMFRHNRNVCRTPMNMNIRMLLFKYNGIEHSAKALHDIILHECVDFLFQMAFRILFANIFDSQLFRRHVLLIFQCLMNKQKNKY